MSRFEPWALHVFTCHAVVLRRKRLDKDTIDLTLQIVAMITMSFPLLLVWIATTVLLAPYFPWKMLQLPSFVAILISIFGVSRITDSIYEKNRSSILNHADEIQKDPDSGTWWAVKELLKIWSIYGAALVIVCLLGRLWYLAD